MAPDAACELTTQRPLTRGIARTPNRPLSGDTTMRAMNLTAGIGNLIGLVCCIVGMNGDVMDLVGRVCGEPGQAVAMAGLAVCAILNGLMGGDFLGRAAWGRDEDQ